jgi:hypothetical protein
MRCEKKRIRQFVEIESPEKGADVSRTFMTFGDQAFKRAHIPLLRSHSPCIPEG